MFFWGRGAEPLTHVELSDEAGHVVVLEELWQNLFGETTLIKHMEAGSTLRGHTQTHTYTSVLCERLGRVSSPSELMFLFKTRLPVSEICDVG